jgi:nucleotide-binding universal stress UspA family protein
MRVILVPVANRPECARALNTAFDLGHRLGASVKGCHIRPHRHSTLTLGSEFAAAAWKKKNTKSAPAAAHALYKRIAEQHGYEIIRRPRVSPGALWAERVGSPEKIMGIAGPVADLIVVSRPKRRNSIASLFLGAALTESARPVLLLPQAGRRKVGTRICIAWDQSPGAARTVANAVPLLQRADAVTIVTCGPEDRPGPKAAQLAGYLAHWGVNAQREQTRGRHVEIELLDACQAMRADMLISGAYSHYRWYEKVLGGTTEFLIHKARIPVLMQHV